MTRDEDFQPTIGRMRAPSAKRSRRFVAQVLAATHLARAGSARGSIGARFNGSHVGRGAGVGQALARRGLLGHRSGRRVIVKATIVKLSGRGVATATSHLRYLQRDGTTRAGEPGRMYDRTSDTTDVRAFRERGAGDRHQFRLIVSPEDGDQYDDLHALTRRLLARAEQDLATGLDWIAVDHFNTGHPHVHVVVRGKDDSGKDLIIARNYLTRGLRERAEELVEIDLGPRTAREIERSLRAEIAQERLTSIDRALLRDAGAGRVVVASAASSLEQSARAGRLAKLTELGLATPRPGGRYELAEDLAETLRRLGERGDIIRTMQRAFAAERSAPAPANYRIYEPASTGAPLVGLVVASGLADEHADRRYLIIDGIDGHAHYVATGRARSDAPAPLIGSIVRVDPVVAAARSVDRTVAVVAANHGGRYSAELHRLHDPDAGDEFIATHERRLEALRRGAAIVARDDAGEWTIATDHLDRVVAAERASLIERPVVVTVEARARPADLSSLDAATWLDRALAGESAIAPRDAGFGREVRNALDQRRRWLLADGLATADEEGVVIVKPEALSTLRRRELARVAASLGGELKLPFAPLAHGERFEGTLLRKIDLADRSVALVQRSHDFVLVPWRPVLENKLGASVGGIATLVGASWTYGRRRTGPAI